MKSKQVREFIDGHIRMRLLTFTSADIEYCAMLAEKEAEERMRQKAVETFKSSCVYKDGCGGAGWDCHPTLCEDLRLFIQKLNEE